MAAEAMIDFFSEHLLGHEPSLNIEDSYNTLKPLIDALEMEGYYGMKPDCNSKTDVNPESPTCLHGSPWSA